MHTIRTLVLVPMLDWVARRAPEGYRRLEGKMDEETARRLGATVATLEPKSLHAALEASVSLFCNLRVILFDRHGLNLNPKSGEKIREEMQRRWTERSTS